jgi:hypothetical protein
MRAARGGVRVEPEFRQATFYFAQRLAKHFLAEPDASFSEMPHELTEERKKTQQRK